MGDLWRLFFQYLLKKAEPIMHINLGYITVCYKAYYAIRKTGFKSKDGGLSDIGRNGYA